MVTAVANDTVSSCEPDTTLAEESRTVSGTSATFSSCKRDSTLEEVGWTASGATTALDEVFVLIAS